MLSIVNPKKFGIVIVFVAVVIGYLYHTKYGTLSPVVNTKFGRLQGYASRSRLGREYFAFLGIPFAQPPVGELRFEPPQRPKEWSGIRPAVSYAYDCAHMTHILTIIISSVEDCLYLNVYTPARNLSDPAERFSVMVYFHGGMFMEGGSRTYGPRFFMDEDIVLVTVNYRVGALGFLNTGDGLIRGNMGLKDQNMALRWVQENIGFFGGKAEDVTIFGQSAGGASVHYHMMSPMSQGLFAKAISQSGVALNPWAFTARTREQAFRLGGFLNCSNETTAQLVECLKKAPASQILETHREVMSILRDPISVYTPSLEGVNDSDTFIMEHPVESLKNGRFSKIPWMAGVVADEGLIISSMVIRNESLVNEDLEGLKKLAKNGLYYSKENRTLTDEVKQIYFGDAGSVAEYGIANFFKTLTVLFADRHFFAGFVSAIQEHSVQAPTFVYFFNHTVDFTLTNLIMAAKGETHALLEIIVEFISSRAKKILGIEDSESHGICHSDEVFLLFEVLPWFMSIHTGHKDYPISQAMVKLWTDFARMQNPPDGLEFRGAKWKSVENPKEISYLLISDDESVVKTEPLFGTRLAFWDSRKDIL